MDFKKDVYAPALHTTSNAFVSAVDVKASQRTGYSDSRRGFENNADD